MQYTPSVPSYRLGLLILLFGYVLPPQLLAQPRSDTATVDDDIEVVLEYAAENETTDSEQIVHELTYLAEHPLNLNTHSARDLVRLPALTPLLAQRIVRFREIYGEFATVDELRAVEGFSPQLVAAVRPYVVAAPASAASSNVETSSAESPGRAVDGHIIQQVGRRLELGRGYHEGSASRPVYEGSPYHVTTRSRFRYGEFVEANLTLDKDAAEPFGWYPSDNIYGFDFWSAYLALRPTDRPLKLLLAGDYIPAFGRGLVFSRGGGFGGSPDRPVRSVVARGNGLKPYRSTAENRFFRGAAAVLSMHRHVQVTVFVSRRALDASPSSTPAGDELGVTRRVPDGFHRTQTERARKDILGETVVGGAIEWSTSSSRLGITGYRTSFSHPFISGPRPYQQYDFRGRTARMISLYGDHLLGPSHWFGEIARAPGGALGGTGGAELELAEGFEAAVVVRHYPRAFISLYGRGRLQNETGVYTGLRIHRIARWDISAAFDQFWHPWLRYAVNRPTTGCAGTVSAAYRPRSGVEVYLRFKSKITEQSVSYEDRTAVLKGVGQASRQTVRLQALYRLNDKWRLRARVEVSRAQTGDSPTYTGSLLYQDIRWSPTASLQFDGRITFFSTEHYAARLFAYENDLLYNFSVPMLNGRGQRIYLLGRWTLRRGLIVQCKYGLSRFLGRTAIGSGWNETPGNRLREVRVQLRVRW